MCSWKSSIENGAIDHNIFCCKMCSEKNPIEDTSNVTPYSHYSAEFKHARMKFQKQIDRMKSRCKDHPCKKCIESKENCNRTEEILHNVRHEMIAFVRSKNYTGSFYNKTEDIEIDVSTSSYEHLLQKKNTSKTRKASIPFLTIDKLCQGRPSCVVKSIRIHVKKSLVNISRLTNSSSSAVADEITILEYFVDEQLIEKLEGNETISIMFSKKNKRITSDQEYCVFLDGTDWSTDGMNVTSVSEYDVNCTSNHLSSFAMVVVGQESMSDGHKTAFKLISYIGSGLSLAGLFTTSVVYAVMYKDLQILTTTRHLVHFNLQIALGLTQIFILAGGNATPDEIICTIVAILVHYFSLAAFSWILLEVTMLYLKLISVYGGEYVKMKTFYLVGWGLPLAIVGLAAAVTETDYYGTDEWCWLSYKNGFQWIFFAPVIIVSSVTLVVVVAVTRVLFLASNSECGDRMNRVISAARGVIILFPTLGLSWAFSVVAVNHDALIWKYLFAIFTSLQGFLIFLIYGVCNKEIRAAVRRKISSDIHGVSTT